MNDRPILLIDALNFFTRHFVVNPSMSETGNHVGGIVGFMKGIRLLADKIEPRQIFVIWEGGGSSRRRAIFKDYKNGRRPQKLNRYYGDDIPDTVENRNYQISLCIELLKHTPAGQIYVGDCEADDVIGYLIRNKFRQDNCVIASSDRDYYQLISEKKLQWSPGQKRFITMDAVKEKYGVSVQNFCTARCFVGDPSDGLPGIKGAGFKTLVKRFPQLGDEEFVSVDEILKMSMDKSRGSKLKLFQEINENHDIARRNWRLMFLDIHNLSGEHIKKIEYATDTFTPSRNKIGFMRILMRESIKTFDADSFFTSLNSVVR